MFDSDLASRVDVEKYCGRHPFAARVAEEQPEEKRGQPRQPLCRNPAAIISPVCHGLGHGPVPGRHLPRP